jgi:hypothetical protein
MWSLPSQSSRRVSIGTLRCDSVGFADPQNNSAPNSRTHFKMVPGCSTLHVWEDVSWFSKAILFRLQVLLAFLCHAWTLLSVIPSANHSAGAGVFFLPFSVILPSPLNPSSFIFYAMNIQWPTTLWALTHLLLCVLSGSKLVLTSVSHHLQGWPLTLKFYFSVIID